MNRLHKGIYTASVERKRWLTSDAPGLSDSIGGPALKTTGILPSEASLDYATRTKQLAKELARGFSAPEALRPRHATVRRTVTDLAGKSSLDHYAHLPGGHIAARAAIAIAAAKGSIELRRCHTARVAIQRQAALAPQLSQARIVKKPRLSLSPTRSRPYRPERSEDGEIEERIAPRFVRIPRSQPVPDPPLVSPTATNLDASSSADRLPKNLVNPVLSPSATPLTAAQKKEEEWYKETLAALVDGDLPEGSLSSAIHALHVLTTHKADPFLPTAITLPRECLAFRRAPFRHSRSLVKDMSRTGISRYPRPLLTPEQKKKTAVINLVDGQSGGEGKGQLREAIPLKGLTSDVKNANVGTEGLASRSGQPGTTILPNGANPSETAGDSDGKRQTSNAGAVSKTSADTAADDAEKNGVSKSSDHLNGTSVIDSAPSSAQNPVAPNFEMVVDVAPESNQQAKETTSSNPALLKGAATGESKENGDLIMEDVELGFHIRKKAPPSHLQKLKNSISSLAEEVEEAKGSVRKQEKIVSPKSAGKKTLFARKLLQRRKSIEQKTKAQQRRQILRRPGSSSAQKAIMSRNGRQDSVDPEETIALNRPRRKARANGRSFIDLSEASSDMDLDDESTSKSAELFKPSGRQARRMSVPTPATRPSRSSPRKSTRNPRNNIGNSDDDETPDRQKRSLRRASNGLQKTEPLKEKVVAVKPNMAEETQSSERPQHEVVKFSDGFKCLKFSQVFFEEGKDSPCISSSDDDEDGDLEDAHIGTISVLRRLSAFDKRRSAQKGVFGLPEGVDDESAMVDRLSKQHDLFSDDENAGIPFAEDSLASKFVESHAGDAKQSRRVVPMVPEAAAQRAVAMKAEGSAVLASDIAGSSMGIDPVMSTVAVNVGLSDEDESAEAKAKNLQSRVCGDMMGTMSEDGKKKVMQWAIRDFSWFAEDTEIMEVTLSCTGISCERCNAVQDTKGLCEESIVLKLWRDMTWRKVRRLRHVLGSEV